MKYYKGNIGVFRLGGKDVVDFLQRVSTNDMENMKDAGIVRTVLLNEKGRIVDFVIVLIIKDEIFLISSKGNELKVKEFFKKYVVTDDVSFELEYLDIITMLPEFDKDYKHFLGFNTQAGNYFFYDAFRFEKIIIMRYNPDSEIFKTMIEKSKLLSDNDFKNIAINKFFVYDSNELNDGINPLECGLAEFISFDKGCYIGQEVISRLDTQSKLPKVLVKMKADFPMTVGDKIYSKESGVLTECGFITSTGFSDSVFTALGFIRAINFNADYKYFINNDVDSVSTIKKFKY